MASHASLNITIDNNTTAHNSDRSSSLTDGEESSGVHVSHTASPSSVDGSHDYSDPLDENEESWGVVYPDEIRPSDSASRPRTSNHHRPIVEAPRLEPARRQAARRQHSIEREPRHPPPRARRPHIPTSSGSVDSNEEWPAYGRGPPQHYSRAYAHYGHALPAPLPNYAPSYSSAQGYTQFPTTNAVPPSQQLVPFGSPPAGYGYPYPGAPGGHGGAPGYFPPAQHGALPMGHPVAPHPGTPYSGHEMIHHTPAPTFYPYAPQGYPVHQAVGPPAMYPPYPGVYSPPPANTPPPSGDSSKDDEKFARIEKLFLDQKADLEAKEAAAIKAAQDAAAKAEADKKIADDIAAAAAAAAAAATEEAEKKAAERAAEEAAKAKAVAEEAEKKATEAETKAAEAEKKAAEAAAAVPPPPPPPPEERKKPIRFKDAVGRKFSFPFHLCNTWEGMEDLIRQAFLHVEVIGPHVAEGHYDLVGPNGEIILPQVWETMIEPDWVITMHMWPMPEPPPPPPPPPEGAADVVIDVPPADSAVPPAPPPIAGASAVIKKKKPTGFLAWTAGKPKNTKPLKAQRKPEGTGSDGSVAQVQQIIV
ncbi:MAG: hypothetical protein LQ341_002367 [Variospora aurantia]|nr:MAG: hypothetical protein LQ341_002367 [Variospora aurantia]